MTTPPPRSALHRTTARRATVSAVLFSVALVAVSILALEPAPWQAVIERLNEQRDHMANNLERVHARLLELAIARDDRDAVNRLSPQPPSPKPNGYGILPEIVEDGPLKSVELSEQTFSLDRLDRGFAADFVRAVVLVDESATASLFAPSLDEFERLRDRLDYLEDQLAYHAKWQRSVVEYAEFFAGRNRLVAEARQMNRLREAGELDEAARIGGELAERLAPLRPTPGLALVHDEAGGVKLPVTVHTDIPDQEFLATFRRAVESAYTESQAARSRSLAIDLELVHVAPEVLYPDGAPQRGTAIDLEAHLRRFPTGALVMTTGAASTHAFTGRAILLGPSPTAPRTLAHEFGHLIGFDDAYLRGYDGRPDGAFGVVLVEWTGFNDDLMGNPGGGRVSERMIDALVAAYGSDPDGDAFH